MTWRGGLMITVVLMTLAPASAATQSPITVDAETHGTDQSCPGGAPGVKCPFTYDDHGTTSPTDDSLESAIWIDTIRVSIIPPLEGVPPQQVVLDPRTFDIQQPVYHDLNATWPTLNGTIPATLHPYLSLESRPTRSCNGDAGGEDRWGLFVTAYAPFPPAAYGCDYLDLVSWCWGPCFIDNPTYMQQNETTITPFPDGVSLFDYYGQPIDSDYYVGAYLQSPSSCLGLSGTLPCNASQLQPALDAASEAYTNSTPDAAFGFELNTTAVSVGPSKGAWGAFGPESNASSFSQSPWHGMPYEHGSGDPRGRGSYEGRGQSMFVTPAWNHRGPTRLAPLGPASVTVVSEAPISNVVLSLAAAATTVLITLGWALYHRIGQREALAQATRSEIHRAIAQTPGLRATDLAERLGIDHSTVTYHLKKMVEWHLITAHGEKRLRYYPNTGTDAEAHHAALGHPTMRAVEEFLSGTREADHSTIAAAIGRSLAATGRAIAKLERLGRVTQRKEGKRVIVRCSGPSVATDE